MGDKQYRMTPDDGHVILLMEPRPDQKSFRDFPELVHCLDCLMGIYEDYLKGIGEQNKDYDLEKLWNWIDSFRRIEIYVYDVELSRYKKNTRKELKEHFITQIKKNFNEAQSQETAATGPDENDEDAEIWD